MGGKSEKPLVEKIRFHLEEQIIAGRLKPRQRLVEEEIARIEAVLRAPIEFVGGCWQPAASIGLARAGRGQGRAALLRRADRAMYEIKRVHHRAMSD